MIGLKTLEDISAESSAELKYDLRQEAIKDIKYFRACKQEFLKLLPWIATTDFNNIRMNAIINYIQWKFNINEKNEPIDVVRK